MRARRFPAADHVLSLPGGTEDNDLWCEAGTLAGDPFLRSLWVPTDDERERIAAGANLTLYVLGGQHPPVAMEITDEQPGRGGTDG